MTSKEIHKRADTLEKKIKELKDGLDSLLFWGKEGRGWSKTLEQAWLAGYSFAMLRKSDDRILGTVEDAMKQDIEDINREGIGHDE